MTKERKSYMGIPLTIETDGQDFKHVKRLNKGVIYQNTKEDRMIKKCIVYREEFFEDLETIGSIINNLKSKCFIHMYYEWIPPEDQMYMTEWVIGYKPFSRTKELSFRMKVMKILQYNLYLLFDEGYYWDGNWGEDILVSTRASQGIDIKICDLDSIKPIWINSTFDQHYPWHWVFDKLKSWKS